MLLVYGYQTDKQITKTRHKLYFCSAMWRIPNLKIWTETLALRMVWACHPDYLTYHWLNPSLHPRLFMSNGSSVSHFLPLSFLTFSPLLLLKQQILVNKHASNPAKNVLLSTGSPPLRTRKGLFSRIWHSPFFPSCISGGSILVPIFSIEEFNVAKTGWAV